MPIRIAIAAATVAVVVLVGSLLIRVSVVYVTAGDRHIVCEQVEDGTPVILTFTHSMYGGFVRETYRTNRDSLTRTGIVTENAAAAEYYAWYGEVKSTTDGYEVVAPEVEMGELPVIVDQIGRHRLQIGDRTIDLAALLPETTSIVISVQQRPLLFQMFNSQCQPDSGDFRDE